MKNPNQLLHAKEVASRLNVSPATLRSWRFRKIGPPFIRICGSVKYRESALEAFLDANTVVHGEDTLQ